MKRGDTMATLNFVNSKSAIEDYKSYFENKDFFVFDEGFCYGTIPFDIFSNEASEKVRIKVLNEIFGKDCSFVYHKRMNELKSFDLTKYENIIFHFENNMYSLINFLSLTYYLDMMKRREMVNPSLNVSIYIYELNRNKSYQESIITQRQLTSIDLESLSMTFFNLIYFQKEKYNMEVIEKVTERINDFPYMKEAIKNYFFIRTKEFKDSCKRKNGESEQEYYIRMRNENKILGLKDKFYFSMNASSF